MEGSLVAVLAACAALALASCGGGRGGSDGRRGPPNILFVIMDDVGIDQMAAFGYGGADAAAACRTSTPWRGRRALPQYLVHARMLAGPGGLLRRPLSAAAPTSTRRIGPNDLANSQVSPYDVTVPKLLQPGRLRERHVRQVPPGRPGEQRGRQCHAGSAGLGLLLRLDRRTARPRSTPRRAASPARNLFLRLRARRAGRRRGPGACCFADQRCSEHGRAAAAAGSARPAVPGPRAASSSPARPAAAAPPASRWTSTRRTRYYVSPLVVIDEDGKVEQVPLTDPRARGYRTTIEADAAIAWIKVAARGKPWMATVSFSAAHTPLQQPPRRLVPRSGRRGPAMPRLRGNVSRSARAAEPDDRGHGHRVRPPPGGDRAGQARPTTAACSYDPRASNTMIVIVGDNGSLGFTVKPPFDADAGQGHGLPDRRLGAADRRRAAGGAAGPRGRRTW